MAIHDHNAQRLAVSDPLQGGAVIALSRDQTNYLVNVLRLGEGEEILIFNGRDGEWRARLAARSKRDHVVVVLAQTRPQTPVSPLVYMFAPLKRSRLDYMVQKAVEMGAGRLMPVITRRTIAERVNLERMRANAVEAAEQCGILSLPEIAAPLPLEKALVAWDRAVPLVFCDEAASVSDPLSVLRELQPGPVGVLIGPEGGFDAGEREMLRRAPFVTVISLGPRIMRADTAAVAALALVNAALGDWR